MARKDQALKLPGRRPKPAAIFGHRRPMVPFLKGILNIEFGTAIRMQLFSGVIDTACGADGCLTGQAMVWDGR
ncbi:hypothetical protein ACI0FS_23080 [Ochrobactrum quorumnocens]|nr:hypothetical protein [[Ochrobactrum] quorumnocens]